MRRRPLVCFVTRNRRRARRDMRGSARPHSVGHHAYEQVPCKEACGRHLAKPTLADFRKDAAYISCIKHTPCRI